MYLMVMLLTKKEWVYIACFALSFSGLVLFFKLGLLAFKIVPLDQKLYILAMTGLCLFTSIRNGKKLVECLQTRKS